MENKGYLLAVAAIGADNQTGTNVAYTSNRFDNPNLKHLVIAGPDRRTKFHSYAATDGRALYKMPNPLGKCRVVISEGSFDPKEAVHTADVLVHLDGTVFVREGLLSSVHQRTLDSIEQIVPHLYTEFNQSYP